MNHYIADVMIWFYCKIRNHCIARYKKNLVSVNLSESIAVNMILTDTYNKYKSSGKQNPKEADIANMEPLH